MSTGSIAGAIGAPDFREWIGAGADPSPPLAGFLDNQPYVGCFRLDDFSIQPTKAGKPFLKLRLSHAAGTVEGKVWDDAERVSTALVARQFVGVRGRVQYYNGAPQVVVDAIAHVHVAPEQLDIFLPRSERDPAEMEAELEGFVKSVGDLPLRTLLRRILARNCATGERFRHAPAAKHNHHAYLGGLLEHTLSVARLCDYAARHYGKLVDRDLLITGALLHDVGKVEEISTEPGFPYSDEGKLLGHILLGLQIVRDAAQKVPELSEERLLLLLHLIASHQGKYEWQSPREPRVLEALLLHHLDDLDAKMKQAETLLSGVDTGWSAYDRSFARDFLRHVAPPPAAPEEPSPALSLDLFQAP